MRLGAPLAFTFIGLAAAAACSEPQKDVSYRPFDAGADADAAFVFPDGGDPELGKACQDDKQCDDGIACTFDRCDPKAQRCRNHPDDTLCDNGIYCDGTELCFQKSGCAPGAVITCQEGGGSCQINRCVEATKSCAHDPRDVDLDGDADDHCPSGKDCDDTDPQINSNHSEVCANGRDDNCNGVIDEKQCVAAQNATCQTALSIMGPGNYLMSTVAAKKTFATTCSVSKAMTAHDVVALVTVPAGPNVDLDLWVTSGSQNEVSVAIDGTCGDVSSELACGSGVGASMTHARARNVAPGKYSVVVTSQDETQVALAVDFLSPSPKPTNEDCATTTTITPGVAFAVELIDPNKDLVSACKSGTGELTYSFTLAQPKDVRVYASTTRGSGVPVVGLRQDGCTMPTDERDCHVGSAIPLFARGLVAGTYEVTVAATTPIDASVLVQVSAPTSAPVDQVCSSAPALTVNHPSNFDLSNHEDAIKDGCLPGSPTAAYQFALNAPSDVMLVARYPTSDFGAVSLDLPNCAVNDKQFCASGYTPVRSHKRNLAAGSYRAVVADSLAQAGTISAYVRPTTASIAVVGADDCSSPGTIPKTGAFLTGDTSMSKADFDESCDQGGQPPGGAPDQVFRLDLQKPQRVVLSMEGSAYSTVLSMRSGGVCPGIELKSGCAAGFSGPRSFLDFASVPMGTYWIIVDGFVGGKGVYNLDVYVLDP